MLSTKAQRLDEAIVEYQNALKLNPNYAEAQNGLGIVLAEKGEMSSALDHFQEAVRLKPDYAEAKEQFSQGAGNGSATVTAEMNARAKTKLWESDLMWGSILMLAVFLIYTPVGQAGFIWDDDLNVTANPCIVGPLGLKEIWTTSAAQFYPLTLTVFWSSMRCGVWNRCRITS